MIPGLRVSITTRSTTDDQEYCNRLTRPRHQATHHGLRLELGVVYDLPLYAADRIRQVGLCRGFNRL
jgi:hypothetical protein